MVFADGLADTLKAWKACQGNEPAPMTVGYPEPDAYFTVLFRSTIVGIECTLQNSAIEGLLFSNRLTEALRKSIRSPGSLSRSMVDAYYNKMPEKLDSHVGLKTHDGALWNTVQQFYREVRNPISHGYQLRNVRAESLCAVFRMFDQIYSWIDAWSDAHRVRRILASTTFHTLK